MRRTSSAWATRPSTSAADDGAVTPAAGPAPAADAVVTMSVDTLLGLFSGSLQPGEAVMQGRVELEGAPETLGRLLALYGA